MALANPNARGKEQRKDTPVRCAGALNRQKILRLLDRVLVEKSKGGTQCVSPP